MSVAWPSAGTTKAPRLRSRTGKGRLPNCTKWEFCGIELYLENFRSLYCSVHGQLLLYVWEQYEMTNATKFVVRSQDGHLTYVSIIPKNHLVLTAAHKQATNFLLEAMGGHS